MMMLEAHAPNVFRGVPNNANPTTLVTYFLLPRVVQLTLTMAPEVCAVNEDPGIKSDSKDTKLNKSKATHILLLGRLNFST
jgi:hypothetical protein